MTIMMMMILSESYVGVKMDLRFEEIQSDRCKKKPWQRIHSMNGVVDIRRANNSEINV